MEKVVYTVKRTAVTAYNHKFKLIFILLLTYGFKKAYDFYQYIKPLLKMKDTFMGNSSSDKT